MTQNPRRPGSGGNSRRPGGKSSQRSGDPKQGTLFPSGPSRLTNGSIREQLGAIADEQDYLREAYNRVGSAIDRIYDKHVELSQSTPPEMTFGFAEENYIRIGNIFHDMSNLITDTLRNAGFSAGKDFTVADDNRSTTPGTRMIMINKDALSRASVQSLETQATLTVDILAGRGRT